TLHIKSPPGREALVPLITAALTLVAISHPGFSQTPSIFDPSHAVDSPVHALDVEETGSASVNASEDPSSNDPDPTQPDSPGRCTVAPRGCGEIRRSFMAPRFSAPTF